MSLISFLPGIQWTSIDLDLPKAGTNVIAYGINKNGKERKMRAFYAPKFTIEDDNEYEAAEYCEESDQYFLKEGWYESNEHEDVHWMIDFPITYWMPLPVAPASEEYLRLIREQIPFLPTIYQARYADWDCMLAVKNGDVFLTKTLLKKKKSFSTANTTISEIGNMAYLFLRSKYPFEKRRAEIELYTLRENANQEYSEKGYKILDHFESWTNK